MDKVTIEELEKAGMKVISGFTIYTESFDKLGKTCDEYVKKQKKDLVKINET